MTKSELIELLDGVPDEAQVYTSSRQRANKAVGDVFFEDTNSNILCMCSHCRSSNIDSVVRVIICS